MDIVIIGNGFDKAHGLKTSYNDFKRFLEAKYPICVHQIEECINVEKDKLWNDLEDSLAEIDYDCGSDLALLVSYSSKDWQDRYNHDFQHEISEKLSFTKNLAKYAKEWINSIEINCNKILTSFITTHKRYLSFNYTDTLEVLYNVPEENIFYIHGKAKRDKSIILGHNAKCYPCDLINPEDDIRIEEGNIILSNAQKSLKKPSERIVNTNKRYFESLTNIKNVYILGHSLSEIDDIYFTNLAKYIPQNSKWFISYYSNDDSQNIDIFAEKNKLIGKIKKIEIEDLQ